MQCSHQHLIIIITVLTLFLKVDWVELGPELGIFVLTLDS